MGFVQYRGIVVALATVPVVLPSALLFAGYDTPAAFVIGIGASALGLAAVRHFAHPRRTGVDGEPGPVTAGARADMAEMRRRLADLKAYQVLVLVPVTAEHHATLRQLTTAIAQQRAIIEAREAETRRAPGDACAQTRAM